jgi:chitinase
MPMFVTPWVSVDTQLKFKLTVSDPYAGTSSAYVCVTINNWHTPPDVANARADVPVLWPPDHKMLPVQILGVVKPSDDKITITGVTQDEPTNGLGDGDTPIDAIIHHYADKDDTVDLRAERSGNRDGRVYRVSFTVADPEQSASGMVRVMVPKSKKTDAAIDSGGNYDSTH